MYIHLNEVPWNAFFIMAEEEYGFKILNSEEIDSMTQYIYVRYYSGVEKAYCLRFEYQEDWGQWQLALYAENAIRCLSALDLYAIQGVIAPQIRDYRAYLGINPNKYIHWDLIIDRLFCGPVYEVLKVDDLTRYVRLESQQGTKEYLVGFVIIPELDYRIEVQVYDARDGVYLTSLDSIIVDTKVFVDYPVAEEYLNPTKQPPDYGVFIKREPYGRGRINRGLNKEYR